MGILGPNIFNNRDIKDKGNRPVIKFSINRLELFMEIFALGGLIAMAFLLFNSYSLLPDMIPKHFDMAGQVDDWGSPNTILFAPLVCVGIYVLLTISARFPHTYNYIVAITANNASIQYRLGRQMMFILKTVIIWMFFYITYASIEVALGNMQGLNSVMMIGFLVLIFVTIGVYMYLSYKNR